MLTAFSAADGHGVRGRRCQHGGDRRGGTSGDRDRGVDASAQELDTFNNDVRLRALKTLAEALKPIQQKKAIIYFSSGMQRSGTDNQVELRAAVNAAVTRQRRDLPGRLARPAGRRPGRQRAPGQPRRHRPRSPGAAWPNQFTQLAAQQETLTTLASDTGGTAFTDTQRLRRGVHARSQRDISSYYILGFASTNADKDGRFRRISVRAREQSRR